MRIWSNLNSKSLSMKLPIFTAVPAISTMLLIGILQLYSSVTAVHRDQVAAYSGLVHERRTALARWLQEIEDDVFALAESYAVSSALNEFTLAWGTGGPNVSQSLRSLYISDNPHPVGKKDELRDAGDGSDWSRAHARHHEGLMAHQRARGYYDLFLFDTKGDLIYSVFKEDDFALNFMDGKYHASGLGEVFKSSADLPKGQAHLTEIAPYAPSADAPAMFMAAPVYHQGAPIGVVAVQIPLNVMTEILSQSDILGQTGQVFLVSENGRALTESRREGSFAILDVLPSSPQIKSALAGEEAHFKHVDGASGTRVTAHVDSVVIPNGRLWGLVFEKDQREANSTARWIVIVGVISLLATAVCLAFVSWYAARGVTSRIKSLSDDMDEIAAQNFTHEIDGMASEDEIGAIARTLENLRNRLAEGAQAQEREQEVHEKQKEIQEANEKVVSMLSDGLLKLAQGDFRNPIKEFFPVQHKSLRYSINDAIYGLNKAMTDVREQANNIQVGMQDISTSADDLSERTVAQETTLEQTTAVIEQMTAGVQSATEHIKHVETTVESATGMAEDGSAVVEETILAMGELEKSSVEINQVVNVIDEIAFQTNLLALNAGVEAARAGESGKGFAVVALEVRNLAQRASTSASEIRALIQKSGEQVNRSVDLVGKTGTALSAIVGQVQQVNDLVRKISKRSQEQSVAIEEVNSGMSQLDVVTQQNASMVKENTAAARSLTDNAMALSELVARFKTAPLVQEPGGVDAQHGAYSKAS